MLFIDETKLHEQEQKREYIRRLIQAFANLENVPSQPMAVFESLAQIGHPLKIRNELYMIIDKWNKIAMYVHFLIFK